MQLTAQIAREPVVIYSYSTYDRCKAVKELFDSGKVKYTVVEVDWLPN